MNIRSESNLFKSFQRLVGAMLCGVFIAYLRRHNSDSATIVYEWLWYSITACIIGFVSVSAAAQALRLAFWKYVLLVSTFGGVYSFFAMQVVLDTLESPLVRTENNRNVTFLSDLVARISDDHFVWQLVGSSIFYSISSWIFLSGYELILRLLPRAFGKPKIP